MENEEFYYKINYAFNAIENRIRQSRYKKLVFIPITIFSILFVPHLFDIPYLDGNIDFVQCFDYYLGGFKRYFENWSSVHPPFKILIVSFFFHIFVASQLIYNLLGLIFGILGIISIYFLTEKLFDYKTALISSLIISVHPLFLATGVFILRDYLMAVLILISFFFYSKKKYFEYSLFCSLAVLTKETALILPASILLIELIFFLLKKRFSLKNLFFLIMPFLITLLWMYFVKLNGKSSWQDWVFTDYENKSGFYTIIKNMLTLGIFNKYAYQNWLQFLILNFNWFHWFLMAFGLIIIITNNRLRKIIFSFHPEEIIKTKISMLIFSASYFVNVLSFQTFTIPRYALPLIVTLIPFYSLSIRVITYKFNRYQNLLYLLISIIFIISLFWSLDPISTKIWGKTTIYNQNIYALNHHLAGNDGITYNLQYLYMAKIRTNELLSATENIYSKDCGFVFADFNNDKKTIANLGLKIRGQECKSLI